MRSRVATLTARIQSLWTRLHRAKELLRVPLRRAGQHGGVQRVGFGYRVWAWLGWDIVLACAGSGGVMRGQTTTRAACMQAVVAHRGASGGRLVRALARRPGPGSTTLSRQDEGSSRHAAAQQAPETYPRLLRVAAFTYMTSGGESTAACSTGMTFRTWTAHAQWRFKQAFSFRFKHAFALAQFKYTPYPERILNSHL